MKKLQFFQILNRDIFRAEDIKKWFWSEKCHDPPQCHNLTEGYFMDQGMVSSFLQYWGGKMWTFFGAELTSFYLRKINKNRTLRTT